MKPGLQRQKRPYGTGTQTADALHLPLSILHETVHFEGLSSFPATVSTSVMKTTSLDETLTQQHIHKTLAARRQC